MNCVVAYDVPRRSVLSVVTVRPALVEIDEIIAFVTGS